MVVLRRVLVTLLLHHLVAGTETEVTHLVVPRFATAGEEVVLECYHNVPEDRLYQINWYQNARKILRFLPHTRLKLKVPDPNISVNLEQSTGQRLVLKHVQLSSTGLYKCTVVTQGPDYVIYTKALPMTVLQDTPRIYGRQDEYHIGDTAQLSCVSAMSTPPAELTWYINDNRWQAPQKYITESESKLAITRKGLSFNVSCKHFLDGEMNLRCSVKIFSIDSKPVQQTIDTQITYTIPTTECVDGGSGRCDNKSL
ncbi:Cell adhesion molecule 3-like 2 [Homarus americanus]|uniref:Cell adhesion molecule 3-like 2 n=1 Tax=Homarus americanus TaxID=6706 RepID=A0A8J5MSD5_HOMAM|nr:Cell adhesion molecule 3-like 2 [Homarus americanus]